MTTKAYILIETAAGQLKEVSAKLRSLPGVQREDAVTGPYDIVAVIEASDLIATGELLASHIHTIGGIRRTATCLSLETS